MDSLMIVLNRLLKEVYVEGKTYEIGVFIQQQKKIILI